MTVKAMYPHRSQGTLTDSESDCGQVLSTGALWGERIALAAATLISYLAASGVIGCGACHGGVDLAPLGVIAYTILLGCHFFAPDRSVTRVGIVIAASVHAGLVYHMADTGLWCAACLFVAMIAFCLVGFRLFKRFKATAWSLAFVFPLANVFLRLSLAALAFFAQLAVTQDSERVMARAESYQPLGSSGADSIKQDQLGLSGTGAIILYEDPHCPHCQLFHREVEPEINRHFGKGLPIISRQASNYPIAYTPTIVLRGPGGSDVIQGLPPAQVLIQRMEAVGIRPQKGNVE